MYFVIFILFALYNINLLLCFIKLLYFFFVSLSVVDMQQVNKLEITPDRKYIVAACYQTIKAFEVRSTNPQPVRENSTFID